MKRQIRMIAFILFLALLLCGCEFLNPMKRLDPKEGLRADLSVYPVYENLTDIEREIWDNICNAIKAHSSEKIFIGTYSTQAELDDAMKRLSQMLRELTYSCPDYFWVDLYHHQNHTLSAVGYYELELELTYVIDAAQAEEMKKVYDARVASIVTAAKELPELFDQVLFVYDTILSETKYDYVLAENDALTKDLGRSAYGCLIDGKTVCSGYALAFRSIMEKLGIECGVEFNYYGDTLSPKDHHVWNYCKLDDEYYYFDLTWDDTGFDKDDYYDVLPYSYLYFGVTADELAKANKTMVEDAPTPDCTGTKYNYFVRQGLSFAEYDYDTIRAALLNYKDASYVTLRFDSYFELEQAKIDLIDELKFYQIMPELESFSYLVCNSDLHLMFIL